MAQVEVVKMDRTKADALELSDQITEAPFNPFLIKDMVVYQQAKMRQGTHATKRRSQVAGSRRKLFKQKGTGSARPGDKKGTQRRGGGIPHGPIPRDHAIQMNKKVRKTALRSALGEKLRRGKLVVLDAIEPTSHKTKDFSLWLNEMEANEAMIVTHELGDNLSLAARNLPSVAVVHYTQLNVYNLLLFDKTLVTREAMTALQERLTA